MKKEKFRFLQIYQVLILTANYIQFITLDNSQAIDVLTLLLHTTEAKTLVSEL